VSGASGPLRAADFFGRAWSGQGVVRSLFNQPLRTFRVRFQGGRGVEAGMFLLEEQVIYDHGASLERTWTVAREGEALVGLEPTQGGRMRVCETGAGLRLQYDRPRALAGPNVVRLHLSACWAPEGAISMRGWSRILAVPLLRTEVLLRPVEG
jgi:hypothetical protein